MSYADLRDFDAEAEFEIDGLWVAIEKLGGGIVGKAYWGKWRYLIADGDGNEIGRGQDLYTDTPKTHWQAALIAADYFTETEQ